MNKALLAIIAAAALGATKKISSRRNGSFNDLSEEDVFRLVGNFNNIKSLQDFMAMDSDQREKLRIQAAFIMNEASSNADSPLAQRQEISVDDIVDAMRNKRFRKNIRDVAVRKANRHISSMEEQKAFSQFRRSSPIRKSIHRKRSQPQQLSDSVLGSSIEDTTSGIVDGLYKSKEYILNPEAFVSFIRLMCGSWSDDYNLYPIIYEDDIYTFGLYVATDDSFVYNPLTDEYGAGVRIWAENALDKMTFLKDVTDNIAISPQEPINKQFLKYTFLNFYEYYVDQVLFDRLIQRWKKSRTINSIVMKELHMLVFGSMYRITKDYRASELYSFLFFSDISGQNLLPFGNCSFESYKDIINSRMKGELGSGYKYNTDAEESNSILTFVNYDGFGSLFDQVIYKAWSFTLSKLVSSDVFFANMSQGGDIPLFFEMSRDVAGQERVVVRYVGNTDLELVFFGDFDYKINGAYPKDFFSSITFLYNSQAFREETFDNPDSPLNAVKNNLYGVFGNHVIYGEVEPSKLVLDDFFEIEAKLLRLGNWASECCLQMTKVINSGQIDLALYLLSPIVDYSDGLIDQEAQKYNIPLDMYPTSVKRKLSKQQKEAIKKKYISPQKEYFRGSQKMNQLRRLFKEIVGRIKQVGLPGGSTLSQELNLPMNVLLWKYKICPERDMDWGKPIKNLGKDLVKKLRFTEEFGIAYRGIIIDGHLKPYYIRPKDNNAVITRQLRAQSKRAQTQARRIYQQALKSNEVVKLQNGVIQWSNPELERQYLQAKVAEYRALADNKTYDSLQQAGKPIYDADEFERIQYYKKFATDEWVKTLEKLVKELSRIYSASTQTISNAPFNRIVGLVFGGEPSLVSLDSSNNELLRQYYEKIQNQTEAIPTQSLTYSGINMSPMIRALSQDEARMLNRKIQEQRTNAERAIGAGDAGLTLESHILKVIDKSLKKQSIFGVPFLSKDITKPLTGIDIQSYRSSPQPQNVTVYSRDGQVENLSGFFPESEVYTGSIPANVWNKTYQKSPIDNYIEIINRAQGILIGGLLQALFSSFSSKSSNYGDIGNVENGKLMFYTKVKKIGSELAVLGDDPLGFREMYRNLSKHSTSLERQKELGIRVVFNPDLVKNKELAKNSSYNENQIGQARKLIKIPTIQKMLNDHFELNQNGKFKIVGSPQPLEEAIINIVGVFAVLDERSPGSRSQLSKQEIKAYYEQYDLYLSEVLKNIEKATLLSQIYDVVKTTYGEGYLPVAEYDQMTVGDLNNLINRYKKYGPYRSFYGVEENFPQSFMDLVNRQIASWKTPTGQTHPYLLNRNFNQEYDDFDKRYTEAFNSSFVERQSEKIGALIGILPVGEGYRIYLPYTEEHLRNVARASNKSGKHRKIIDLNESIPYAHSTSAFCIADSGQRNTYVGNWAKGDIFHMVVVTPDGDLHSLMTMQSNGQLPSTLQQWRANVVLQPVTKVSFYDDQTKIMNERRYQTLTGGGPYEGKEAAIRKYYLDNFGLEPREVLEIDSKIVREFGKLMYQWFKNPITLAGGEIPELTTYPGITVGPNVHSLTRAAKQNDWIKNSPFYKKIAGMGSSEEDIMERIDIGTLQTHPETKTGYYNDDNINFALGDIDTIKKFFPSLSSSSYSISEGRDALIRKLKSQKKL